MEDDDEVISQEESGEDVSSSNDSDGDEENHYGHEKEQYQRAVRRVSHNGKLKQKWLMRNPIGRCERCRERGLRCEPKKLGSPICFACGKRGGCSKMETYQVEAVATMLHIPLVESQRRFDMWIKNKSKGKLEPPPQPNSRGTQGTSCLRSARTALKTSHRKKDRENDSWSTLTGAVVATKSMAPEATSVSDPGARKCLARYQGQTAVGHDASERKMNGQISGDTCSQDAFQNPAASAHLLEQLQGSMRFKDSNSDPSTSGSGSSSMPDSQVHSISHNSRMTSEFKPSLPKQHPSSSLEGHVRRPLLPRNPLVEHLSKELRKAEEQNVALRRDITRVDSAREALERELESLRAFHDKWSQRDLEAPLIAERRVMEESTILVKAEERHDTVHELEKNISTSDESHQALKTERDALQRSHERLLHEVKECESFLGLVFSPVVESDTGIKHEMIKKVQETLRRGISGSQSFPSSETPRPASGSWPSPWPDTRLQTVGPLSLSQPYPQGSDSISATHRSTNDKGRHPSTSQKRHRQSPIGSSRNPVWVEETDSDVEIVEVKRARIV